MRKAGRYLTIADLSKGGSQGGDLDNAGSWIRTSENSPSETVWKIERRSSVTYAPAHEQELPNRSYRRRMGDPRAPRCGAQKAGTTEDPQPTRDPRRRLLRPQERLPLATLASGLSSLGNRLLVVRQMENGRYLRAAQRRVARAVEGSFGQESAT